MAKLKGPDGLFYEFDLTNKKNMAELFPGNYEEGDVLFDKNGNEFTLFQTGYANQTQAVIEIRDPSFNKFVMKVAFWMIIIGCFFHPMLFVAIPLFVGTLIVAILKILIRWSIILFKEIFQKDNK